MNKSISIVFLLLLAFKLTFSQVSITSDYKGLFSSDKLEYGFNIGANYSFLSNIKHSSDQHGLNLGLNIIYKVSDRFHVNPILFFAFPMGARGLDIYHSSDTTLNKLLQKSTLDRKLSYFSLPITLRYRLFGKTYIEAGPQFSLLYKSEDVFVTEMDEGGDFKYKVNLSDRYKTFDAGVTIGFTQKLRENNGVSLTLRYYYGLMDISTDEEFPDQHNSAFYFSCGIPINGKKKE